MAVTEMQLLEGIADCMIGEPTPEKMIKLASYYVVKDYLFREEKTAPIPNYSMQSAPQESIDTSGSRDFLRAVRGKDTSAVMDTMDELMDTLAMIQPRIYDEVMRRISEIK